MHPLYILFAFVDGQELLSAMLNSSPQFHPSSCLHGLMSYFKGCPGGFLLGLLVVWFGLLFFVSV